MKKIVIFLTMLIAVANMHAMYHLTHNVYRNVGKALHYTKLFEKDMVLLKAAISKPAVYRKLVYQYHPDIDRTFGAKERFQDLQSLYKQIKECRVEV